MICDYMECVCVCVRRKNIDFLLNCLDFYIIFENKGKKVFIVEVVLLIYIS